MRILSYTNYYPSLVQVDSIGKSHEGRDIWLVTVTNQETGPAAEKPAPSLYDLNECTVEEL